MRADERRFAKSLPSPTSRLARCCLAHPLNSDGEAFVVGPVTLWACYHSAGVTGITEEGRLVAEAILADVLGYA